MWRNSFLPEKLELLVLANTIGPDTLFIPYTTRRDAMASRVIVTLPDVSVERLPNDGFFALVTAYTPAATMAYDATVTATYVAAVMAAPVDAIE